MCFYNMCMYYISQFVERSNQKKKKKNPLSLESSDVCGLSNMGKSETNNDTEEKELHKV